MRQPPESQGERTFNFVLGECLDALFAGATVKYCLRRYPEHADELEPLLHMAAEIKQTPPLTISDAGFERGRQRVRQAAAALRNGRPLPVPHHVPLDDWPAPPPQPEPIRRGINWFEVVALTAIGAALVIMLVFTAPPDSSLYPLRSSAHRVLTWLLGTPGPVQITAPLATPAPTPTPGPPTETVLAQTTMPPFPTAGSPRPTAMSTEPPDETVPPFSTPSLVEAGTPTEAVPGADRTPAFTPTPLMTWTPTRTPTPFPTVTAEPSLTSTASSTRTPTETTTPTETPAPTATPSPLPSPTPAPTRTPTVAPTRTRVPTALPTATAPATSELPDLRLVDEVQLTHREYAVVRAWSPDGERILFTVPRPPEARTDDWETWVMKRDGSGQQQLAVGRWPTFSPDGQRVAYVAGAGDDRSVWIVSVLDGEPQRVAEGATGKVFWPVDDTLLYPTAEGLRAVRLTPAGVPAGEPELWLPLAGLVESDPGWVQWSVAPDGRAVLLGTPSQWWLVRLASGEAPQAQPLPARSIWSDAWTRDGSALAFQGEGEFLTRGIYLLSTDGRSGPRRLVSQWALGDRTGGIIRSLNWSPDGDLLLVEWSSGSMGDSSRLYVVDRAGNYRLLAGLGDREVLNWSPDGEWMVFHRAGNVWVARVVSGLASP